MLLKIFKMDYVNKNLVLANMTSDFKGRMVQKPKKIDSLLLCKALQIKMRYVNKWEKS